MVRQYVGARYVPKFADPVAWTSGTSYEAMTIVTYNNSSYTSKMPVPATVGNPAGNPDYWALTGNYNAQVEQYRQEVSENNAQVEQCLQETETVSNSLTTEITNRKNADTALQGQISAERTAREEADSALSASVIGLINSRSKYRYLWHDNFYRANDATSLGTNGDSLNSMIYSYAGSQLGIRDNTAYNTGSAKGYAFADMGVSDCTLEFQADLTDETYTTRGVGVIGRYSDAQNYLYCSQRREYIRFGKFVNGEQTELGNIYIISPAQAPKKVGFELSGDKISVLINGVVWTTVYDNFNENITTHGITFDGGSNGKMLNFGVKRSIEWQTMIDAMDSGTLPFNIVTENAGKPYNFAIENTVVNGSETALRFENRKSDNYKRSEIAIRGGCKMLDEQVFSFDMLLDEDYSVVETLPEIIMQFHDFPDDAEWSATIQPTFSIFLKNGHYFIHSQWSDDKKSIETGEYDRVSVDIGDYLNDIGKWVNWKIHVKWAYNDFFEPILRVYKDGKLVFESKKPNVINAANCPYFKVGMYTFNYVENPTACVSEKRTMYVDNVFGWY